MGPSYVRTLKKKNFIKRFLNCEAVYESSLVFAQGTDDEEKFGVTYEVEILEVSNNKAKVKVLDFTSPYSVGRDPKNRQTIINLNEGAWLPINELSVIKDERYIRNHKLEELGI